jgi:hypothetical protein
MSKAEYPRTQKDKALTYLLVMEEVRARLELIRTVLGTPGLHINLISEICHLQYRHIAELVAIGALLAYGDFSAYKKFEKSYSPVEVFKHFEGIWPHFFPQSVVWIRETGGHRIEANTKPNAITRVQLEELWQKSGDKLHRLSVKKFFKRRAQPTAEGAIKELQAIRSKIVDLLETHLVSIPNPERMLVVHLFQPDCRVRANLLYVGPNQTLTTEEFKLQ